MTRPTAPDGSALPRRHIAHFLDTVAWAGATIHDAGGRLVVRGDRGGLLQAEVTRREGAIRAWWAACEGTEKARNEPGRVGPTVPDAPVFGPADSITQEAQG